MSHQPFETWLFDPTDLTPEQSAELNAHLETCTECAQIQAAWESVAQAMQIEEEAPVPAGFTQRFMKSLPERKAMQRARQIRRTMFFLGGGTLLAMIFFLGYLVFSHTPVEFMMRIIQVLSGTADSLGRAQDVTRVFVSIAPQPVLIFLGLALASWVLILSLTWITAIVRFSVKGEGNQ